jgi:hypothetical protein
MPAGNSGRVDKDQSALPARPPPPQAQPEQAVTSSEASIRASKYAELVAKCDILQEQITARGEGRLECGDYPQDVTHRA